MSRLLLTVDSKRCPFRCSYCFSRFSQFQGVISLETVEETPELLRGVDVLYPACDVDLFARKDAVSVLERVALLGCSISVSTKASLSEIVVSEILRVHRQLHAVGLVLKTSISFSNRDSIPAFEPGTADYKRRLENLRLLSSARVPRSITIKPILSSCSAEEYGKLLADCAPFINSATIGEEYRDVVDFGTPGSSLTARSVQWLPRAPIWPVVEQPEKMLIIADLAKSVGIQVFTSDYDLVQSLSSTGRERNAA
jgi:hypothetical protein